MALHPLPFTTFASIGELGLDVRVYCPKCFATRRIDPLGDAIRDRQFTRAKFTCRRCQSIGLPKIIPPNPLRYGGPVTLVHLWCDACFWEADALPIDEPPWNVAFRVGHQFQCPGCDKAVRGHVHGPAWSPGKHNCGIVYQPHLLADWAELPPCLGGGGDRAARLRRCRQRLGTA